MTESSLYERLGGAFAIAAVVDHFSDATEPPEVRAERLRIILALCAGMPHLDGG